MFQNVTMYANNKVGLVASVILSIFFADIKMFRNLVNPFILVDQ